MEAPSSIASDNESSSTDSRDSAATPVVDGDPLDQPDDPLDMFEG